MTSDRPIFAGIDISSGRKPLSLAVVDDGLDILALETGGVGDIVALLKEHERAFLTIHVPTSSSARDLYTEVRRQIGQAGFKPFSQREADLQWSETRAEDCFRAFQPKLLPRRSLEGRIQRALILFEAGLRCSDPMDYYEEITRYKLLQGILPAENIYSIKQLDALAAAYVAWLAESRPGQVVSRGMLILPKVTESDTEDSGQLTYL
jgi:hypothetical protein